MSDEKYDYLCKVVLIGKPTTMLRYTFQHNAATMPHFKPRRNATQPHQHRHQHRHQHQYQHQQPPVPFLCSHDTSCHFVLHYDLLFLLLILLLSFPLNDFPLLPPSSLSLPPPLSHNRREQRGQDQHPQPLHPEPVQPRVQVHNRDRVFDREIDRD